MIFNNLPNPLSNTEIELLSFIEEYIKEYRIVSPSLQTPERSLELVGEILTHLEAVNEAYKVLLRRYEQDSEN